MELINISVLGWTTNPALQDSRRAYVYGNIYCLPIPLGYFYPFQLVRPKGAGGINRFELVQERTGTVIDVLSTMQASGLSIIPGENSDTIRYLGTTPLAGTWEEGAYYARFSDGRTVWYSDYFNMVRDTDKLVKVEWWHNAPIAYRDGVIDYSYPYRNYVYLTSDIGKPAYPVDRDVITRNGVEYNLRVTTWKEYKFEVIMPEYLADCLRMITQHDNIRVLHLGRLFDCQSFTMDEVAWQDRGDLGVTVFTFRTGTLVTTSSHVDGGSSEPNPSACVEVRYEVNTILGLGDLDQILNNLGSYGIVGEHIAINGVIDLGAGPSGSFNVNQITHIQTTPNQTRVRDAVAGDVFFDRNSQEYYVHTGTALGFTRPRVNTVTYLAADNATITGYGIPGASAELLYKTEFSGYLPSGIIMTYSQLLAGVTINPEGWTAVKLVFATASCGVLQESVEFFLDASSSPGSPGTSPLTGWGYSLWGIDNWTTP
jgi:hypothetical protein